MAIMVSTSAWKAATTALSRMASAPLPPQEIHLHEPDAGQDQQDQGQLKDQAEQQQQAQAKVNKRGQVEHGEEERRSHSAGKRR